MSGTFTWVPDYDAEESIETAVLKGKFGDGYEFRVEDGLNNVTSTWTLVFSLRTKDTVNAINAFLKERAGAQSFSWAPPGETARKFKCEKWTRRLRTDSDSSISCTFVEVHEP